MSLPKPFAFSLSPKGREGRVRGETGDDQALFSLSLAGSFLGVSLVRKVFIGRSEKIVNHACAK